MDIFWKRTASAEFQVKLYISKKSFHTTKLGQISIFLCVFNIVDNEWVTKIDRTLQTFVKTDRRQSLKATDFGKHIADKNEIGTFHPVNILDIIS